MQIHNCVQRTAYIPQRARHRHTYCRLPQVHHKATKIKEQTDADAVRPNVRTSRLLHHAAPIHAIQHANGLQPTPTRLLPPAPATTTNVLRDANGRPPNPHSTLPKLLQRTRHNKTQRALQKAEPKRATRNSQNTAE